MAAGLEAGGAKRLGVTDGDEERSVGRKEREQKREGRGESGEGGEREKGGGGKKEGENRQQGLAPRRAGTLAQIQALVCVGRVTIDADGSQGFSHRAVGVT